MTRPAFETVERAAKAARRELALRSGVYPKWVQAGRMKRETADEELAAMRSAAEALEYLASMLRPTLREDVRDLVSQLLDKCECRLSDDLLREATPDGGRRGTCLCCRSAGAIERLATLKGITG